MAKGGDTEREVANLLSLWWTNGERDDVFGRSDGSGGRFTRRKKAGKDTANQGGDITFTDSIGEPLIQEWSIECKSGYGKKEKVKNKDGELIKSIQNRWDILDLIDSRQKGTVIEKLWQQCNKDAQLTHRQPVLIFRRNGRKLCMVITHHYLLHLQDYFNINPTGTIFIQSMSIHIMLLNDFFMWIPDIRISLGNFNKIYYNNIDKVRLNKRGK